MKKCIALALQAGGRLLHRSARYNSFAERCRLLLKRSILIASLFICLFYTTRLCAQSVLYAPATGHALATNFEAGKAGTFYWIQTETDVRKRIATRVYRKEGRFEVFDARLNRVKTIPYTIPETVLKQYFVAGDHAFDQLLFLPASGKTRVSLNRYAPDGTGLSYNVPLRDFPGRMQGNDFLLLRSPDKKRLLLLGFEAVEDATPRVHAILYDSDWNLMAQALYQDGNLTQPFIQYDFTHHPLEHFDNSTAKLANNGDWLMIGPSRRNNNYVLFHFQSLHNSFTQTEIALAPRACVQTASLSLDAGNGQALAGLLLQTASPSIRKVRTAQYLLSDCRLAFDTTYRFSTLPAGKTGEDHLYEHYFLAVPGSGFLFLKEYGRPYQSSYPVDAVQAGSDEEESTPPARHAIPAAFNRGDYTRYNHLSGTRKDYDRGDLSLNYFPATHRDSCWSGLINKTQTGELNSSFLSYACLLPQGKAVFLYNDVSYNNTKHSTTTILDQHGHALNEGVVFWRSGHTLDFQKARQLTDRELMVPYEGNRGLGFAIIRL